MFRRAASYMSLHVERDQLERHAAALEQQAVALEHQLGATAATRAQGIVEGPTSPEGLAVMKPEERDGPAAPETDEASNPATLFRTRATRLRELAENLSAGDKELLLAIALEYDELAKTVAERPGSDPA